MYSSPAPAAALFRYLDDQSLDYCILSAPTAERIELVVARDVLPRVPGLLRTFGSRNELEVIDHRQAPDGVHRYRLGASQRPARRNRNAGENEGAHRL